jgi:hypothetical protein
MFETLSILPLAFWAVVALLILRRRLGHPAFA